MCSDVPYRPVLIPRAYESVVEQIEQAIADGHWPVGDQLPSERELAERLSVSRVVVREAMRNLEAREIIEVRPGSGVFVRLNPAETITQSVTLLLKLEESSLLDLYAARQALEMVTVPLAATQCLDAQCEQLYQLLEEMSASIEAYKGQYSEESFYAYSQQDAEFHCRLAELSGNQALATVLRAILPLMLAARVRLIKRSGNFARVLALSAPALLQSEHHDVLRAIAAHDPTAATQAIAAHLKRSVATYRDL